MLVGYRFAMSESGYLKSGDLTLVRKLETDVAALQVQSSEPGRTSASRILGGSWVDAIPQ